MKCKNCGIAIDKDEHKAFSGYCATCYEEKQSTCEQMDFEER